MIRSCYRLGLSSLLALLCAAPAAAQDRWEKDIAAFEASDRVVAATTGEIVFVGSSTIRYWDLAASFPELKTINRGFGGSEMADSTRFVERIVVPYSPRVVVVYAGDNDMMSTPSEEIAIQFERFVRAVHAKLPDTRILYIGIKPSLLRWAQVDRMRVGQRHDPPVLRARRPRRFRGHRPGDAGLGREAAQGALRRRRPAPHAARLPDPDRARPAVPAGGRRLDAAAGRSAPRRAEHVALAVPPRQSTSAKAAPASAARRRARPPAGCAAPSRCRRS